MLQHFQTLWFGNLGIILLTFPVALSVIIVQALSVIFTNLIV